MGDALLQKSYTVDFLTKKRIKNDGYVQKYYVEDSHPPIITKGEFAAVQKEFARRLSIRPVKVLLPVNILFRGSFFARTADQNSCVIYGEPVRIESKCGYVSIGNLMGRMAAVLSGLKKRTLR